MRMPAPKTLTVLASDGTVAPPEWSGQTIVLADSDTTSSLDELYAVPTRAEGVPPRWVRMNMLGTLNARVTGPDATSDSISNRADRAILKRIRAMSDAVVVGAQTVRAERHATTGLTRLVIVTGSGDLSGHRISPEDAARGVSVLCPVEAGDTVRRTMPGAEIVHPAAGDDRAAGERDEHSAGPVSVADILEWCDARGLRRIVVEGGAKLIGQFLDAHAIDEVCLTQAPVFGPDDAPGLPGSIAEQRFRRALLSMDDLGYVYSRLVAEPSEPEASPASVESSVASH